MVSVEAGYRLIIQQPWVKRGRTFDRLQRCGVGGSAGHDLICIRFPELFHIFRRFFL